MKLATAKARARAAAAKLALTRARKAAARRKAVVAWAHWGVAHEPQIHYREVRPMPIHARLPLTTDCSGFVTLCYYQAGAPDPNGFHYDGAGYTGTILKHGTPIDAHHVLPGDLIVYGTHSDPNGHHVTVAVTAGPDPMTVSHGQERGPFLVRHSAEAHYQPSGVVFLRFPML